MRYRILAIDFEKERWYMFCTSKSCLQIPYIVYYRTAIFSIWHIQFSDIFRTQDGHIIAYIWNSAVIVQGIRLCSVFCIAENKGRIRVTQLSRSAFLHLRWSMNRSTHQTRMVRRHCWWPQLVAPLCAACCWYRKEAILTPKIMWATCHWPSLSDIHMTGD